MADTVDSIVLISGRNRYAVRLTNISDGTGEAAAVKVDKSTLIGPDGTEPGRLVIEEIQSDIRGFDSVRLHWDHTTDDEVAVLPAGSTYKDYRPLGGLVDPNSTGGTGDIVATTSGAASGNTYDIILVVRLKD